MSTPENGLRAAVARAIVEQQPILVALFRRVGEDFLYEYVNDAYQATRPHVRFIGQTMGAVWPETADSVVPLFTAVYETGEPIIVSDAEFTVEPSPGEMVHRRYSFEIRPLEVEGERFLLEVADDVTGIVAERETASEVAHRLEQMLERMTDAVGGFDCDWRFTYLNTQAERVLGRNADDLLGKVVWDEFEGFTSFRSEFERAMEEQEPAIFREHQPALDAWLDVRAYPSPTGLTVFFSNANEQVRLEEENRRALEALKEKDRAIRQAYSDVIDAVTGGRLIILGRDEVDPVVAPGRSQAYRIHSPSQLGEARARVASALSGCLPDGTNDTVLAFSEGATNMLKHAGGGRYRIALQPQKVQIVLEDEGPGIDFRSVPKVTLVAGYSTAQTLGMGFTLMMELVDRVMLCSDEDGTVLVLEKDLGPAAALSHPGRASIEAPLQ